MNLSKNITLFVQCLVDTMYPEVADAMVDVLERVGLVVNCPTNQTCCGQPAFNAGHQQVARTAARKFIEIFENAETIVSPSGSCVNMVRNHYPELFKNDPVMLGRAQKVAAKTFEFTEFLVDVLQIENVGARFQGKVTYHASCHLNRVLGVNSQPRKLLANISDMTFIEMLDADRCCGFGGTFAIKYSEISGAILEEKINKIIDTGAEVVTGCDMGCLMNIQGMLSRRYASVKVLHIAQLLAGK